MTDHRLIIRPGMVVQTWCGICMQRTDHRYTGHALVCIDEDHEANARARQAREQAEAERQAEKGKRKWA